ncbi:uncharacterized protein C6orf132 homolog [Carettochelys insculpta]|uniref:uncharacterized protein C6orf132 homolog n=1 Tax=Carettochelys insculpta TaxID=44489 RepID=UPI003EBEDAFC
MKKNNSVQGTFSKLFGKKHASNTSLYATNPSWIFTPEITSDGKGGPGDVVELYYEDNRLATVTDSGTATLKPRPRVRPLLTFIPLKTQETHGVAVPTPSVPEGFEEKAALGLGSQVNGNYRMYSSVGDLRSKSFERDYLDNDIPPPPAMAPPPPPPSIAPPPPPMEIPLPPDCMAPPPPPPPPPPPMAASPQCMAPPLLSSSISSSPSQLSPPDFMPPAPPLMYVIPPAPPLPPPAPPMPQTPISNGIPKWKSEVVLNTRQTDIQGNTSTSSVSVTTPPASSQKDKSLSLSTPEPHLTFPRSVKVPPATPVRSSSIPMEEKDSCEEDGPISRQPHARPPLPPSFTIRPAAKVYLAGEAEQKSTWDKQIVTKPIREIAAPASPRPGSEKDFGPKCELPATEEELDVPSPDYTSSDDDWKEPSNLNKLKQELSALLSSSSKSEETPLDKPVTSRPANSITDHANNRLSSARSKQAKPIWREPPLAAAPGESERKEKGPTKSLSTKENSSDADVSAPGNQPPSTQASSVMKVRNELEALFSPVKEGKPLTGLRNPRHGPGTNKVALNSGNSQTHSGDARWPKPVANQHPPTAISVEAGITQEVRKMPSALTSNKTWENLNPVLGSQQADIVQQSPDLPRKQKDQLFVPASSSPSSEEAASPMQTSGLQTDFSLLPYKTHRAKTNSTDSLSSLTPSQTVEEEPISANKFATERSTILCSAEKPQAPAELPSSSMNSGQEDDDNLIHPVTGEKVEKGSPMALLLAAKQRAQRVRPFASRQNSYVAKKPPVQLSDKFANSSQSETGSTTFFYRQSKPYSFVVVPKSPQKESPAHLEGKQHDGLVAFEGKALAFSEPEQRADKPLSFSSTSEQCWGMQKTSAGESQSLAKTERFGAPSLFQGLLESSPLRPQDRCPNSNLPLPAPLPPSSLPKEEEEKGERFDYEIIPPPPEFSNDTNRVEDAVSNVSESRSNPRLLDGSQPWERRERQKSQLPNSGYGNSYALPSKIASDSSRRNSNVSQLYQGGNCSAGLPVWSRDGRPLIKKRLYVSESNSSYTRTSSRNVGTPGTYGHSVVGYTPQAGEGMRRVSSIHRNAPTSIQGRRMSVEPPGKALPYSNPVNNAKNKVHDGDHSAASAAATSRPAQSSPQYSTPVNTFTVRPGTRQPISYVYQGSH